jgi:hypothetical protein
MVRFLEKKRADIIPLFALGTLVIQVIVLLLSMWQAGSLAGLSDKQTPTLVQLEDGKAIRVGAMDYTERTPATIRRFVGDTMTMLMNWSGTLPPATPEETKNPKLDPGVSLGLSGAGGSKKIAQTTWQAGFAFDESLRPEFMKLIASLTPQNVFSGDTQAVLVINYLSEPTKIGEGKWKIGMVSNLLVFNKGDKLGKAVAFNKELFVKSVEAPKTPEGASKLEKTIYNIRQSGLEIYAVRELARGNL